MSTIQKWYDLVLQQMAAESYFEDIDLTDPLDVEGALRDGNNRRGFPSLGNTRFTDQQADEFLENFQIVHQLSDNPNGSSFFDNTGLSATLIRGTNGDGAHLSRDMIQQRLTRRV